MGRGRGTGDWGGLVPGWSGTYRRLGIDGRAQWVASVGSVSGCSQWMWLGGWVLAPALALALA